MNPDDASDPDDRFSRLLAEYEAALVAGAPPPDWPEQLPAELASRLERARSCLLRLNRSPATPTLPAVGGTVPADGTCIGRFRVVRELGRGTYGVVLLACDPKLGRLVALKVPRPEALATPDLRQRFLREAEAAGGLDHPNIVPVYETAEVGPVCYIASAFCEGPTLAEWLKQRRGPVPVRTAAHLVAVLADAVEYTHGRGVLHRDLKPGNVLLHAAPAAPADAGPDALPGVPRVCDFGLAKLQEADGGTRTGVVLGTPAYMAPEQAQGQARAASPATDVYGLGGILYELLTGRPPFQGDSDLAILHQVAADDPVAPRRLRPDLPADLETVCLKCLEKSAARRYPTAAELAADLRRFLDGAPVRARPPSVLRLAAHRVRRHPVVAVLAAAGVLLALTVVVGLFWHSMELAGALEDARRARDEASAGEERAQLSAREARENERRARQSEYASQMRLIDRAVHRGNRFLLCGLLDRYQDAPGEADLRGFEWYYFQPFCQSPPRGWRAANELIRWLAWSPDGKLLASVATSGLRLWNAETGEPRVTINFSPTWTASGAWGDPVATFAPAGGRWLAVRSGKEVQLWNTQNGDPVGPPLPHPGEVHTVVASADGNRLITAGQGPITVWDLNGKRAPLTLPDSTRGVSELAVSSDGRSVVAYHDADHRFRLWDVATGKEREQGSQDNNAGRPLSTSGDSVLAGVYGEPGRVRIVLHHAEGARWDISSAARFSQPSSLALARGDRLLAVGTDDGSVQFFDVPAPHSFATLHWLARPITALSFSPDGKRLAVGTAGGMLYLVDVPNCRGPDTPRLAHGPTGVMAFSPDGKLLAAADSDRSIKLFDTANGHHLRSVGDGLTEVGSLAFLPGGQTLVSHRFYDDEVVLTDVATGKETYRLPVRDCASLAASPCSRRLAVGTIHGTICLFDTETRRALCELHSKNAKVSNVAFAPSKLTLAAVGDNRFVEVWDLSRDPANAIPASVQLEASGTCLAFPDDQTLVTGEYAAHGLLQCWQITDGALKHMRDVQRHKGPVNQLEVSRDGQTLLCRVGGGEPCIYDVKSLTLRHHLRSLASGIDQPGLTLAPSGDSVAIVNHDGALVIWNRWTWEAIQAPGGALRSVRSLVFSPDGKTLVTGSDPGERRARTHWPGLNYDTVVVQSPQTTVRSWDVATGAEHEVQPGPPVAAPPSLVALSPDGKTLAAGGEDGTIRLWNAATWAPVSRLFVGEQAARYVPEFESWRQLLRAGFPEYPESVRSLAFSRDGRLLAGVSSQGTVRVWSTADWQVLHTLPAEPVPAAWALFSAEGNLVTGCGGQVWFHNPLTGESGRILGGSGLPPTTCAALSRDGRLLAVGYANYHIRLWDLATGREKAELIGHDDEVSALAFSPDGRTLASASHDHTVKLWSVAAAAEVASLEAHDGKVLCLAFSADGTTLASGGENVFSHGQVFLWRAPRR